MFLIFCFFLIFPDVCFFRALRLRYLRECLMDDRNSVTITLRGGKVEGALVWQQDGNKKFSVLAAASRQRSGHVKDGVAGLEVPWLFLCFCFLSCLCFFLLSFCVRVPLCDLAPAIINADNFLLARILCP